MSSEFCGAEKMAPPGGDPKLGPDRIRHFCIQPQGHEGKSHICACGFSWW